MTDNAIYKVLKHFKHDADKTELWLNTNNPLLGNMKPIQMLQQGRYDKLNKFIDNCIEGNNI